MNTRIETAEDGRCAVVCVEGEIGFTEVPTLHQAISDVIESDSQAVFVDLSAVSFIASDGLGALILAHTEAESAGKELDLIHPQPHIAGLLRKTQLTRLFKIYPTVDEALKGG